MSTLKNIVTVFCCIFALGVMYFAKGAAEAGGDDFIYILGIAAAAIAGYNFGTEKETT